MSKVRLSIGILFLAAMISAAGCGISTGGGSGGGQSYLGGTGALDMQFMNGAPPDYIFDNNQFDYEVQVKLENVGEIDIADGNYDVSLVGIDLTLFGLTTEVAATGPMVGKYLDPEGNVIPGDVAYWTWASEGYNGIVNGNTPYTVWAEACYVYGSEAQTFLCYKADDMLDQDEQAICLIRETKTVQNAASPIQVTRLTESPMGSQRISFTFDLTHSGSGQLYLNQGGAPECLDDIQNENGVLVTVASGGVNLACNFGGTLGTSGVVQLYNGHFTIRCTEDVPDGSNWESLVTIKTEYDYKNKISKQIVVKASG